MSSAPNLAKMHEVHTSSQQIGEFLDWLLHDRGVELMRWQTVVHEEPCTHTKVSNAHEALIGVARLNAEFHGEDPDLVVVPTEWHPVHCKCEGTNVVTWEEEGWMRARPEQSGSPIQAWLADYFDIDLNELETERRAVLEALRAVNGANK